MGQSLLRAAHILPSSYFFIYHNLRGVWLHTSTHTLQTSTHTNFRCRHPPTETSTSTPEIAKINKCRFALRKRELQILLPTCEREGTARSYVTRSVQLHLEVMVGDYSKQRYNYNCTRLAFLYRSISFIKFIFFHQTNNRTLHQHEALLF